MSDPVRIFEEIAATHSRCFWLDGGGAREWSRRRSMIGWLDQDDVSLTFHAALGEVRRHRAGRVEVIGSDIFAALQEHLTDGDPGDHWVGYFGYAARPDLPARPDPLLPDAVWMRPGQVRFFDHDVATTSALPTRPEGEDEPVPGEYRQGFAAVQEALHTGNSYEVNLTYRRDVLPEISPVAAYVRLRELNPAPYAGYLQHVVPGHCAHLLSSSPERFALVTEDRMLETKPIKGTTPRGRTPTEDARLCERLATDPRFRAENLMIVDLLRNDVSMVCRPGTVEVPVLMDVESYTTVHQLVSTVRGRLREDVSTVAALRALFPAGSMTGAPKLRTMQIIDAVETSPRGAYSGAFGWVCADGRADLGVVIRSLLTTGDGRYRLGTGGGITVHSDVGEEYAESRWKADRLVRVFGPG